MRWGSSLSLSVVVVVVSTLLLLGLPGAFSEATQRSHQDDSFKTTGYRDTARPHIDDTNEGTDLTSEKAQRLSEGGHCSHELDLLWHTQIDTQLYTTPLIVDLFGDGQKDILVGGLTGVYGIDGATGDFLSGSWPVIMDDEEFLASPVVYDVNGDGEQDVMLASRTGYILTVDASGELMEEYSMRVPPARILRDWNTGTNAKEDEGKAKEEAAEENEGDWAREDIDDPDFDLDKIGLEELSNYLDQTVHDLYTDLSEKLTDEGMRSLGLFLPHKTDVGPDLRESIADKSYEKWQRLSPKDAQSYVEVPAHILATPVVADLGHNGRMELIVSVSYGFETWNDALEMAYGPDFDPNNYIAGGVAVFDLLSMELLWSIVLDVTTDNLEYKGYVYGSPAVVDLDHNGSLDIIVGTGTGLVYVLDSYGRLKKDMFTMMLDVIYAGIVSEDVTGDGVLDIIVTDKMGNVVCFDNSGSEVWETRVKGAIHGNPSVGDINGDGIQDVVVASDGGGIYAFRGTDGELLPNFPVYVGDSVRAAPLITRIHEEDVMLYIVVTTIKGHLFLVSGFDACAESIEIGGTSHTMVLSDDLTGNGMMDWLVSTDDGDLYLIGTEAEYRPLWSWPSENHGCNGWAFTEEKWMGISVSDRVRSQGHVSGSSFTLEFEIHDTRGREEGSYRVEVYFGWTKLFRQGYAAPGVYQETVKLPPRLMSGLVRVVMMNENGQVFSDSFALDLNSKFYRIIKWILVFPFFVLCAIVLLLNNVRDALVLPS
eukprot:TRINITY_DN4183_c0_g1_i1.p1 TRINITY_DN4183_c0_g1~~TRINITY_DN4183_c0_g1_i1.p1  ORF type:complete len:765 (-),score=159.74 TRINITY_DN4183_c0_g1_i1:146-2440(-)